MSTDTTTPTPTPSRWVRCVFQDCEDLVRNDPGARRAHIDRHEEAVAIRLAIKGLGAEIDGLRKELRERTPTAATSPIEETVGDWPEADFDDDDEPDADEDAGLAAVLTTPPTIAPDDDLEDPTADDLDSRAAAALNTPITYGQTGVIA